MKDFNIDLFFQEMLNKVEYSAFLLEYHQMIEDGNKISEQ